jgi:CelD/BcsL family acetyltransferase involved in cellulose biosynthesis
MTKKNFQANNHSEQNQSKQMINDNKISFDIYNSFDDLADMKNDWDDFIEKLHGEIFLSYDWCRIWWKYYGKGRKLLIIMFRNGSEIIGILPVFHEKIRMGFFPIRSIKIVGTDFTNTTMSIPINHLFIEPVLCCFRNIIEKEWQWDIIRIGSISGKYEYTSKLVNGFKIAFGDIATVEKKEEDVETYFDVPVGWDEYLKQLSTKQRTNARRAFKALTTRNLNVSYHYADRENMRESFDNFVQMHQSYWNKQKMPGHFMAWPQAYEFHLEQATKQAERGKLRLLQIKINGKSVAYEYSYSNGLVQHWFLYGRSPDAYELGFGFHWLALRAKLEFAADEGVSCIDDMRGKYEYKQLMGGKVLPINSIYISPTKSIARQRIFIARHVIKIINIIYYKIWRMRLAQQFKITPKTFWDKWLRFSSLSY